MVEGVVYDTLITKSFYFMMNVVFGSFSTPNRCCWPSLDIQRWGKECSTRRLRVPLWLSFGSESKFGGGRCLWYFGHKILLFNAEHGFWIFSTRSRCCWPSLDIQRWGKECSTRRLRVPLWSSFGSESEFGGGRCLRYFDHKILLFNAEHGFWLFFNPNQVLRSKIFPLGVHHYLHNWSSFKPKIDISDIFIDILLYY